MHWSLQTISTERFIVAVNVGTANIIPFRAVGVAERARASEICIHFTMILDRRDQILAGIQNRCCQRTGEIKFGGTGGAAGIP